MIVRGASFLLYGCGFEGRRMLPRPGVLVLYQRVDTMPLDSDERAIGVRLVLGGA